MSEWLNLSSEQKYLNWKLLRDKIKEPILVEEKLDIIADFFFSVPIGKRCIDFYSPKDWPTPWEILHNNSYCKNTISVLIYYTVKFIEEDVNLMVIDDGDDRYLVVRVKGDLILNYELGKVAKYIAIKDYIKIIDVISAMDIKTIT